MRIMQDSPISFPGLFGDWEFTVGSVALDIGNGIYWYGIIIATGLLLAVVLCMKQKENYGIKENDLMDGLLWGIPVGVLGARIYYVLFYLDRFRNADGSINWGPDNGVIAIWDGGMAIYGTVIAVVLLVWIFCRKRNINPFALMDLVVMGLLVGQLVGRWGNFMNREAFGDVTTLPWRMRLVTVTGEFVEVHPTFLYESLWNLVGLILLLTVVAKARRFDGENTAFYCLWYGMGRFWIEGLRTDSLYLFDWQLFGQPVRVSQALSLVLVLGAAIWLFYKLKLRPSTQPLYVQRLAQEQAQQAQEQEEETV